MEIITVVVVVLFTLVAVKLIGMILKVGIFMVTLPIKIILGTLSVVVLLILLLPLLLVVFIPLIPFIIIGLVIFALLKLAF